MLVLKILVSLSLSCCSAVLDNNIDSNSYLFLLSRFLELQSDSCGYVQLCTIEKRTNLTFTLKKQPCCRPCSCDETCSDVGNCCPDFWLRDLRNISLNHSAAATKHTETIYQRHYLNKEIKDNVTSCVSSRLQNRANRFGFEGADEGFIMISVCPDSYNENKTRSNCEGALQHKTSSKNTFIPVTSVETGRTYRNLFCLECHEGREKRFVPWESWLTCSHKNVVQDYITPPDTLFTYIALGYFSFCNIVYRPPSLENITTITCKQAHVTSCPETMTKNTTTTLYEKMCREFYLPVYDVNGGTLTIYRNIACYLCSKEKVLPAHCYNLYPDYRDYNLQINIEKMTSDETHDRFLSHLDIRFDSICEVGYVYDEVLKYCRKVLCPRLFYLFNGSCEPILKNVHGVYFKIMLEITPQVLISSQFHKEYEDTIYYDLTRIIKGTFPEMHTSMWRKTDKQKLISNVVCIHFKNENKTYADTIQQLQTILDTVSIIQNNSLKVSASVNIAVNVEEATSPKPKLLDRDTGLQLVPVRVSPEIYSGIAGFEISKSHFCYRLELNKSEFIRIGKYHLKVIRTNAQMGGVNNDATENGTQVTCISDIISIKSNSTGRNTVENTTARHQENPSELFIILGSLVALVFLIAALRLIINCRHGDDLPVDQET